MRFFILLGLAVLVACKAENEKANVAAPANASGESAEALPLSGDTASTPPAPQPIPADMTMPEFAPQYPGSTIKAVNASPAAGAQGVHEVTLATSDDAGKIAAFYREKFTAIGLQKTSDFLSGGTGMISAAGKGRRAAAAITKEQDHNVIIVTYSGE